ncbi:heterokaryon incompatibility protein-domain-containing protein [Podospora didyma]|uniref:Heterokaryon incompatibility protein-domain-containing protein n=1 Tax=Podospora didyma TaxID=330526 RepID=A0AAE0U002_9PEZI|nr:heterokaryon incompatibility protein-domain-containing protein [Podospora didyma]
MHEVVERSDQDGQALLDRVGIKYITENLHLALQNLRRPDKELVLWVDAVCINQLDIAERNSQVNNMPKTYSHALSVIVLLGQDSDGSGYDAQAVAFLGDLATLITHLKSQTYSYGPWAPEVSYQGMSWRRRLDVNKMVTGFLNDTGLTCLQWFLDRPWFRRRWIIQEVVLAKNVIVHCGPRSISWDAPEIAMKELSGNILGPFTESNRTNM